MGNEESASYWRIKAASLKLPEAFRGSCGKVLTEYHSEELPDTHRETRAEVPEYDLYEQSTNDEYEGTSAGRAAIPDY